MIVRSIRYPELFEVPGAGSDSAGFGCDQEWYNSEWQRLSGCGPTAASNIIYYLSRTRPQVCGLTVEGSKTACLSLMEMIWTYVTPTEEGVDTARKFHDAVKSYFEAAGIAVLSEVCDLPEDTSARPPLHEVLGFLIRAMDSNAPAAFLNLCNGEEENLEAWHWVTVISLEYSENQEAITLKILDESRIKEIDLKLWYETTALGGGFVRFSIPEA
jgi:hypothetical protein